MNYLVIAEFSNYTYDDIISDYRLAENTLRNTDDLESFDMLTESLIVIKGTLRGINQFLNVCSDENHSSELIWYNNNNINPKIVHEFWRVYNTFVTTENYIETEYGQFVCDENLITHMDKQGIILQRYFNKNKSPEAFGIEVMLETIKQNSSSV